MKPEHKEFDCNGNHYSYDTIGIHTVNTDKTMPVRIGVVREHIDYRDDDGEVRLFAEFIPNEHTSIHAVCSRTYKGKDLPELKRKAKEDGHKFESGVERLLRIK